MRQGAAEASEGDNVKRRLLIAAVLLLAGAAVNVAVAWGCARWSPVLKTETIDDWMVIGAQNGPTPDP